MERIQEMIGFMFAQKSPVIPNRASFDGGQRSRAPSWYRPQVERISDWWIAAA